MNQEDAGDEFEDETDEMWLVSFACLFRLVRVELVRVARRKLCSDAE